jgi:hypothetical protein
MRKASIMEKLPAELSGAEASQGVKLGSVRYVLAVSLALCAIAGVAFWLFLSK